MKASILSLLLLALFAITFISCKVEKKPKGNVVCVSIANLKRLLKVAAVKKPKAGKKNTLIVPRMAAAMIEQNKRKGTTNKNKAWKSTKEGKYKSNIKKEEEYNPFQAALNKKTNVKFGRVPGGLKL